MKKIKMTSYSPILVTSSIDLDQNGNNSYSYFIIDASSNNITITMTNQCWDGQCFSFIRIDSSLTNTVNFVNKSGITVNGGSSVSMSILSYAESVCYSNNWIIPKIVFTF